MKEDEILQELVKFNVTDAAVATMRDQYMGLTIKGLEDAQGYKAVHEARMVVVKKRTAVTKTGKELREDANRFNKAVLAEEKRILGLLAPIEAHLGAEETKIDNEKARIKAEAEAREAARIQARVDQLEAMGMGLSGGHYRLPFESQGIDVPLALVTAATDEQFGIFVEKIQGAVNAEIFRLKEIETVRKAEADRLAQVAEEQERERERLEGIARNMAAEAKRIADAQEAEAKRIADKQAQREAEIKAAQDAIEAEKKAIADAKQKAIDDARRAEELEQARKEAAEKARLEAEGRAAREAQEREAARIKAIEDARRAKNAAEEEARREAELRPDKEKMLQFANFLTEIDAFPLKNKRMVLILTAALKSIAEIAQGIRNDVGAVGGK